MHFLLKNSTRVVTKFYIYASNITSHRNMCNIDIQNKTKQKKRIYKVYLLSGIKTKRPTNQTTKRKPIIQPNACSLIAPRLLPSFPTPDNS